jgi:putative ABC transport system permease protein
VNERFARELGEPWAAIGKQIGLRNRPPRTIIGVVRGMTYLGDFNPSQVFVPAAKPGRYFTTIVARVNGRADTHLGMVRDAIKSVDPNVPVFDVKTMDDRLTEALARPKFYSTAVLFFTAFALLLAVLGIYGAVSYAVTGRTHEMGVRMALGTTPVRLRAVILRQSLIAVAAGAVPGIIGALLSGQFLEKVVEGATSISSAACAASVMFIAMIAAMGVWAATRRIARLEIVEILRAE